MPHLHDPLAKIHYIYFWHCAQSLGAPLYICWYRCACVPAHVPHCPNPLYLFYGNVPYMCELVCSFVEMAVLRACPCAPIPKSTIYIYVLALCLICGSSFSFVEIALPQWLPMCPTAEIHYIYCVAMCLICVSLFVHLLKWLCLRACPCAPIPKSTIYILWHCAWSEGPFLFIC